MFERFLAVPLHFTFEFLGFLVVAGGAFLVPSRPGLIPGSRTNRVIAALGFGALAAAQILHGGSFGSSEADTGPLLIALKTLGMALILIGIVGASKTQVSSVLAAPAAPVALSDLVPAFAAGAAALMAFVASRRVTRELRRLAVGAALLGIAEGVIAFGGPGSESHLSERSELFSHLIRTAGYGALASWLWTGVRSSIRTRFVASFVTLLVAVVLALSSALTGVISNNVERNELERVSGQIENVRETITGTDRRALASQARLAAVQGFVEDAVATGGDARPTAAALEVTGLFDADAFVLMDGRGRLLGAAGNGGNATPDRKARLTEADLLDILGSPPVVAVVGSPTFDNSSDLARIGGSVARIGVAQITHPVNEDRVVGAIALVDFFDITTVTNIERNVGQETTLLAGLRVVATTLPGEVAGGVLVPAEVRNELGIAADAIAARPLELSSGTYYTAVTPLESDDGITVGYLVLSSPSTFVTTARADVTKTLFLVALAVGAIVLLLAYYSGSRITRPIQMLTETAQRIREGDLKAQAEVAGEDEVGQLGETFNEMTTSLFRMTNDLRQAAREEHHLRSQVETIIQSMADGLVAVGPDGKVFAFNREAEQLTGIRTSSALGKPISKVLDVRDSQGGKVSLPIFDLAEGSVGGIFIHSKGQDPVPVSVVSASLRNEEGEAEGGVAVLRDMTREREVERMKSEFLSNISHELRTPLTPIKGYAEILVKKDISAAKSKQFSRGILESTGKLERIVELLVDFAALEAGRLSPRSASVDLAEIVEKLAADWEERTPDHRVVAEVAARLPKVVGDERLLRRSFEELIDNAVKFSPQGGTIKLEVHSPIGGNGDERRKRSRAVEVTVSDEGIGIQPEDLTKIFSDFQQLDGSETRSYGGLGLGLAFVRRIVEAHAGTVSVDSEPDQGTRLTVSLPAARAPEGD
jgi:two-component system sensor histidine kinase VicK